MANPVLLYSIGKDSSVMLHLAMKAFYPAKPPFPLMHIGTGWDFRRHDRASRSADRALGLQLIVQSNEAAMAEGRTPFNTDSREWARIMLIDALKAGMDRHGFDAAFGGGRRDEEKSRAKERVFSVRSAGHGWDPRNQRPGALAALQQPRSPRARRSASFRSRTGPSSTSGSTSGSRRSRSCRSTSPSTGRWSTAAAR